MILDIISLIFNATSITLVVSYPLLHRNREPIEFSISKGFICPSCKNDIDISANVHDPKWQRKIISDEKMVTVCVQCKRNNNLGLLLGKETFKNKVSNFILSKEWRSYYLILVFGSVILNLLSVPFPNYGLNLIGSSMCLLANIGFTIRNHKTTRRKGAHHFVK